MDVREAIGKAKQWFSITMQDEDVSNLGLDEVKYDEQSNNWLITLGFSRPWNSTRNALTAISGDAAPKRVYRVIAIRDGDGHVLSMTRRNPVED